MKSLSFGLITVFIAPAAIAQSNLDWLSLLTMDGQNVSEVEGATRVDIDEAKALHDAGAAFLDTRNKTSWGAEHITGAKLAPRYISEEEILELANKGEVVVFYCDCDSHSASCNLSPHASARSVSYGFENVYFFSNYGDWKDAGHPLEAAN